MGSRKASMAYFKEKISDKNIYRLAKECFPGKIYKVVNGQGSMGCCPVLWISILKIVFSKTYLNIQKTFYMWQIEHSNNKCLQI